MGVLTTGYCIISWSLRNNISEKFQCGCIDIQLRDDHHNNNALSYIHKYKPCSVFLLWFRFDFAKWKRRRRWYGCVHLPISPAAVRIAMTVWSDRPAETRRGWPHQTSQNDSQTPTTLSDINFVKHKIIFLLYYNISAITNYTVGLYLPIFYFYRTEFCFLN